jgi:hypothetical protein
MFRYTMAALTLAMVLTAAACNNSIVGPSRLESTDGGQPIRPPAEINHVCVIDERAVEITSPEESQFVNAGDLVAITWQAREYCSGYVATTRVSYDNGQSWQTLQVAKKAVSAAWRVPSLDGVTPIIEVTVDDGAGDVRTASLSMAHGIYVGKTPPPQRDPQQHD